jgi:hypothetical protein
MRPARISRHILPIVTVLLISAGIWTSCGISTRLTAPILFPNLIADGGFERPAPAAELTSWRLDPADLFGWDAPSASLGRRSLFIDSAKIAPGKFAAVSLSILGVESEKSYLFEISLLKDRDISGLYPIVSLFGQERRLSDFWTAGAWQKIPLYFKSPKEARAGGSSILKLAIPAGGYRLWLDDLALTKCEAAIISPKKGARVGRGGVDFRWKLWPTDRLLDIKIVFSRDEFFKGEIIIGGRTNNVHGEQGAEIELPPNIEAGKWSWRLEVSQNRNRLAVSKARPITIKRNRPFRKPAEQRRAEDAKEGVDYPDFFPIGIYGAAEKDLKDLKTLGFNSVAASPRNPESMTSFLVEAAKADLRVFLSPPPDLLKLSVKELQAFTVDKAVSDSILAWYLEDEPEGRSISPKSIWNKRDSLRRAGFRQPGAITLNRSWRAGDYVGAADVILADPYPIPHEPLSWLSSSLDEIRAEFEPGSAKRIWAVIQAFGWDDILPEAEKTGRGRAPTPDELRALSYLAITHGARGLFYYSFKSGRHDIRRNSALWEGLKKTVEEVRTLPPILLSPGIEGKIVMECDSRDADGIPAVHVIAKRFKKGREEISGGEIEEGIYVIAVNTLNKPVRAAFKIKDALHRVTDSLVVTLKDLFSGQIYSFNHANNVLDFAPFDRKVLKIIQ